MRNSLARVRLGSVRRIVGLAAALSIGGAAQAQSQDEAQVKAAFVYSFLKFVEWPSSAFSGANDSVVVAVLGRGASSDAAAAFLAGKPINERPIAVRRWSPDQRIEGDSLSRVHAVFVAGLDAKRSRQALESLNAQRVLVIGEAQGFATDGGAIGMFIQDKRVRFDVNTAAIARTKCKVSSRLLALARTVVSAEGER